MGENIDDLRTYLEQTKMLDTDDTLEIEKKRFMDDPDIEKFETALSVTKDLKRLTERVDELEVLNYGLWLMLEKKGFTREEYNAALAEAKEKVLTKLTAKNEVIICPKCGRQLQAGNIFSVKCIYCGYEEMSNPYTQASTTNGVGETPAVEEEAYDVTKDLNFDEE